MRCTRMKTGDLLQDQSYFQRSIMVSTLTHEKINGNGPLLRIMIRTGTGLPKLICLKIFSPVPSMNPFEKKKHSKLCAYLKHWPVNRWLTSDKTWWDGC